MRHLLFLLLSVCLHTAVPAQNAETRLLMHINGNENRGWDKTMELTSASVYPLAVLSTGTLLATGYVKKDREMIRNGYKMAIAFGVGGILAQGLKISVQRARPYEAFPGLVVNRMEESGYSFPSGHTTFAFSMATSLTLSTKKWYVAAPAYTYAGLVGYSRMRLGVHYPTDVLGGVVTGCFSSWITWKADQWLNRKK